jgi:hypothetical protein
MRPAGEVRQALLQAAIDLATHEGGELRGATLQEIAHRARVAIGVARRTVDNMRRSGELRSERTREVPYRNRPVAEYVPREVDLPAIDVAGVMSAWARR